MTRNTLAVLMTPVLLAGLFALLSGCAADSGAQRPQAVNANPADASTVSGWSVYSQGGGVDSLALLDDVSNGYGLTGPPSAERGRAGFDNGQAGLPAAHSLNPASGAFYNDGRDGDIRARTENIFDRALGQMLAGVPVETVRPSFDDLAAISPDEEVWIITRPAVAPQEAGNDDRPGCGGLVCQAPGDEETTVPMPLRHTDVKAAIAGYIATVDVTQQFHNPFDEKIEAVYVFPLPQNAAVAGFVMIIGDRKIRGIIKERGEAERIYLAARAQGHVASLLTQERPNIFTQKVANIEPGRQVNVEIRYFHTLRYTDGAYQFVFPMVVGPRFNPPGSTGGVAALPRGKAGTSGQSTEITYLRPGERSGHDIDVQVEICAGVPIRELSCRSHRVTTQESEPGHVQVALDEADRIPNKDFVLDFRVAGDRLQSALVTHRQGNEGYFTLMIHPPDHVDAVPRGPVEMIFVVDCSGSMSGDPLNQAKAAMRRALRLLRPDDTFQIIRFSNEASTFGPEPVLATGRELERALDYVDDLNADGGTMMIRGVKAALDFPHDAERLRFVTFMTDGFIGNDAEILNAVAEHIGNARIFSFGVGSSTNRFLMERMARLGRGAAAFLGLEDPADRLMETFFRRISHAALLDVSIDFQGARVTEVYPKVIPDLFVGRPVALCGRFEGPPPTSIRVEGRVGGRHVSFPVVTSDASSLATNSAIPQVWARLKIADLVNGQMATRDSQGELATVIRETALEYSLMSAYTAFVAVDSKSRTEGGEGTTVPVAVPVPAGVKYETTVGGK